PDFHQLVKAITRERATIPDVQVHECGNFHREPVNILHPLTDSRDEQNQANQTEDYAESSQANGLNSKKGVLRHPHRAVEANSRQKKKSDSRKQGKNQIPFRSAQKIRKRPQPSAQP